MKKKKIPIGISDFRKMIEGDYYYVDKSLLIKEILDSGTENSLITRPRRFGKTLNLSMLKCFFEAKFPGDARSPTEECSPSISKGLFQHLKIWQEGEEYTEHCGKYPVIFLTFKNLKEPSWDECYVKIKETIASEYKRHKYLLNSNYFSDFEKEQYNNIIKERAASAKYSSSLQRLSEYLYKYYNQKAIVLIDEYDTPIHEAYEKGYYQNLIDFLRSFLGAGLKDNSNLEKGVLTGILRVAKENIFSDLNNLEVLTVLEYECADKFGFTEPEVIQFLKDYEIEDHLEDVKTWYNGYVFGEVHDIYNPWSIINYVKKYRAGCQPFWVNTSSNSLINTLLIQGDRQVKDDLGHLLKGEPISKVIYSNTIFSDIGKDSSHLWSFLLFAGYLKIIGKKRIGKVFFYNLSIPNMEVEIIYETFVRMWFSDNLPDNEVELLIKSLLNGDSKTLDKILQKFVLNSMSYFDPTGSESEKVYHAFVLGLLIHIKGTHLVKSNRESGFGRYDIMLIPHKKSEIGIIIEFKKVDKEDNETLEMACDSALWQIKEKEYESELRDMGINNILKYAIAFEGKKVLVKSL
ncbi:MAG: AAA family ATPase [Leptospiraceae bacterium]|nr:AAA family ATPase [Leptospiraceae bacterium]MCP5496125.1 AAA family ATPase [Leptospiraceae bacterium]